MITILNDLNKLPSLDEALTKLYNKYIMQMLSNDTILRIQMELDQINIIYGTNLKAIKGINLIQII